MARPHVFLDIDIDGWRAAYQRAVDFVAQNSLKYSLSSDNLLELGGSEKKRVRTDYYPNDFDWSSRGPIGGRFGAGIALTLFLMMVIVIGTLGIFAIRLSLAQGAALGARMGLQDGQQAASIFGFEVN